MGGRLAADERRRLGLPLGLPLADVREAALPRQPARLVRARVRVGARVRLRVSSSLPQP